ncbi:hypothetical protein HBB16_04505 [Pseudonocardia sp. MCCB 268]|nr:hypothetical protein [Pseudonocardia cytotoxica]
MDTGLPWPTTEARSVSSSPSRRAARLEGERVIVRREPRRVPSTPPCLTGCGSRACGAGRPGNPAAGRPVWVPNRMDSSAPAPSRLVYGDAYLIVWPGETDGSVEMHYNPPVSTRAFYDLGELARTRLRREDVGRRRPRRAGDAGQPVPRGPDREGDEARLPVTATPSSTSTRSTASRGRCRTLRAGAGVPLPHRRAVRSPRARGRVRAAERGHEADGD